MRGKYTLFSIYIHVGTVIHRIGDSIEGDKFDSVRVVDPAQPQSCTGL